MWLALRRVLVSSSFAQMPVQFSVFTLELESGQLRKIADQCGEVFYKILPYE
jgi:CRISPR/Cas system-associated endoribonuclease Cas2